jgi:hypothetical protein
MQSRPAGIEDKLIVENRWSTDIDEVQTLLRKQILHARVNPGFGKKFSCQRHPFGLSLHHRINPEASVFAPPPQVSVNGRIAEADDGAAEAGAIIIG